MYMIVYMCVYMRPKHYLGCWSSAAIHDVVIAVTAAPVAVVVIVIVLIFQDRAFLCRPSCPGTHFLEQAILELKDRSSFPSASGFFFHHVAPIFLI